MDIIILLKNLFKPDIFKCIKSIRETPQYKWKEKQTK